MGSTSFPGTHLVPKTRLQPRPECGTPSFGGAWIHSTMPPLKRCGLHLENITPASGMDQLIFVRSVHVFRQSIVIGIANRSCGRLDPEFRDLLVVDNADILLGFNRWLQHCCFELIVVVH